MGAASTLRGLGEVRGGGMAASVQIQVPHGPVQYLQQWTIPNFLGVHQSQDSVCSLKSIRF